MINKMRLVLSKGLGFVYVFAKYKFRRHKEVHNKDILIIFGGHLGNAVIGIDLLLEIKKLFPLEQGWNLYILCNEKIRVFCNTIAEMRDFEYLDISYPFEDGGTTFSVVYKTLRALKGRAFNKIIVSMAHIMPLAQYIVATTDANESIGVFDRVQHKTSTLLSIEHNVGNLRWYFERAFSNSIYVPYNMQEAHRHKYIIRFLGNSDYKVRIYPIKKLCDFEGPDRDYITISVDSASTIKRWEANKFAQVANYIIENYKYTICLTGGPSAENIYEKILKNIERKEYVQNFIGKTSFDEWVELIRGSRFHISVDSGSIHIAASVGTQSFCLIGAWDGERVLPYQNEIVEKNTISPICVYMDNIKNIHCYGCNPLRGLIGAGNQECLLSCKRGNPCYCLSMIEPRHVITAIDRWMNEVVSMEGNLNV